MPQSPRIRSCHGKSRQAIDQTSDGRHTCAMLTAVVTIRHGDTLKPSDLPNRLFNDNPKLRERPVVDDILGWTIFATRLTARRKAQRAQLGQVQIGQIAAHTDGLWQSFQQSAVLQQLDVGGGTGILSERSIIRPVSPSTAS